MLSVIVPTYNERDNMCLLIPRLSRVLESESIPYEILVMDDDSPDGTCDEVQRLSAKFPGARCIRRMQDRGLSPAVMDGFREAEGEIHLVMDADLSHPIEVVPQLYRAIARDGADVAVGSRHIKGGGIEDWPLKRKVISWGASMLARPLTSCSDPMSGFFAIRPSVIKGAPLRAKGYKILLEVLVKGKYDKVVEVPITFKDREVGESKLGSDVMVNYVQHLMWLYLHPGSAPLIKFLAVGGSGIVVDMGILTFLLVLLGDLTISLSGFDVKYVFIFQAISFAYATTWNFVWNRHWTFDAREAKPSGQYARFFIVATIALIIRSALFSFSVNVLDFTGMPKYQIALLVVIVLGTVINYLGSRLWAFKK